MGKFQFTVIPIEGLVLIEPTVFEDERGFFMETYSFQDFKVAGLDVAFVQDNHSFSRKGVLRGLHFQKKYPQGKLIRVVRGQIFDVAVDIRRNSPTFGRWYGVELSAENRRQFYISPGFAHGFLALSDAEVLYKVTEYYHPGNEGGIIWNDPDIGIPWPIETEPLLSPKDRSWGLLRDLDAGTP
ncbi:MAG: dTDP-4-dehydrorhamnose 3,5-epimerase [Candidatus Atribacteria bacterium]|nr:dTDP-4-dehydrorhamnose 3,5-epimerase [Candidatus Atribacteria bacterium]